MPNDGINKENIFFNGEINDAGEKTGKWFGYDMNTDRCIIEENYEADKLEGVRKEFNAQTGQLESLVYFENGIAKHDLTAELKKIQKQDDLKASFGINHRDVKTRNQDQENKLLKRYGLN